MNKSLTEPLVSVIIPFYNRTSLLLKAIRSVIEQTYKNYEIIIINDGSAENDTLIREYIEHRKHIVYIKYLVNHGPSYARNIGIEKSNGEYIAFLDSDDTWDKEKLSRQIKIMVEKNLEFTHTSYYRIYDENKKQVIRSGNNNYIYPIILYSCRIATPTVVIKKDLLGKTKFNERYACGEDWLLWINLSRKTRLHGIDEVLAFVSVTETSNALNIKNQMVALFNINQTIDNNYMIKISFIFYHSLRIIILYLSNKLLH